MASNGVCESVSSWPSRRARRHAAASKLQHLTAIVEALKKRVMQLESQSAILTPEDQPEAEQSPAPDVYSRERLLRCYSASCVSPSQVPELPNYSGAEYRPKFTSGFVGAMDELYAKLSENLCAAPSDATVQTQQIEECCDVNAGEFGRDIQEVEVQPGEGYLSAIAPVPPPRMLMISTSTLARRNAP